jgi:aspartokinase-like uncharacterized kinase
MSIRAERRIVLKLGGSLLFSDEPLESLMAPVFRQFENDQLFMIVGGGELIESMRLLHRHRSTMNSRWIHWECIRLLRTTWEATHLLLPSMSPISDSVELVIAKNTTDRAQYLIDVSSFYDERLHESLEPALRPEPSWNTTTDTLAWLLAYVLGADAVVLLKSCDVSSIQDLQHASEMGIVDPEIVRLSKNHPLPRIEFMTLGKQAFTL